jgi:predicted nucleotidyltransferase
MRIDEMTDKEQILERLKNLMPQLSAKFGVRNIGLFGSYVHNTANDSSDIDLIIEFDSPPGLEFINLCDFLENVLDKKVDILTPDGLKSIRVESVRKNITNSVEYVRSA